MNEYITELRLGIAEAIINEFDGKEKLVLDKYTFALPEYSITINLRPRICRICNGKTGQVINMSYRKPDDAEIIIKAVYREISDNS